MTEIVAAGAGDYETQNAIASFLFHEAELLDNGCFEHVQLVVGGFENSLVVV